MSRNHRLSTSFSRLSRTSKFISTLDWKPEVNDVIIPLMGPTGAGKSTFINFIAGKEVTTVGHDLTSCTAKLLPVVIDFESEFLQSDMLKDRRLVLVDTPGFSDTHVDDADVLHRIGSWLETMYPREHGETKLAGIVYLHDISLTRMLGSTLKNLDVFQKLCGEDALKRVVLCTTKWSDIYEEDGERRTEQLKEIYWKEMIKGGSTVHKFKDSQKSAWDVIAPIIKQDRNGKMDALQIQEELVEAKKLIPETEAGRQLRYSLDQLLTSLKRASSKDSSRRTELDAQIAAIRDQMRAMHIPVTQRILGLLDLGVEKILDKFMFMNAIPPSASRGTKLLVPAVGARLEADVKELIMLLGEEDASYERLFNALIPASVQITKFGSDILHATTESHEVRCWSVKKEDSTPLFVVAAPSFDSLRGGLNPFEKVRTWLRSSCREDMKFGIIVLRSSSPSGSETSFTGHALESLVEQSGLKSKTLFATFASKANSTVECSEETNPVEHSEPPHAGSELIMQSGLKSNGVLATSASEPTGTVEHGFDDSLTSFQETKEQALKMFRIALRNPASLDLLLEGLQTISEEATNGKGRGSKRRFRLFRSIGGGSS